MLLQDVIAQILTSIVHFVYSSRDTSNYFQVRCFVMGKRSYAQPAIRLSCVRRATHSDSDPSHNSSHVRSFGLPESMVACRPCQRLCYLQSGLSLTGQLIDR